MHHSKDLVFTFMMMLILSRCIVIFNNYSTLHMVHSIPLAFFSYYRIMIIFESDSFKPSIYKTAKYNFSVFLIFVTCYPFKC